MLRRGLETLAFNLLYFFVSKRAEFINKQLTLTTKANHPKGWDAKLLAYALE
jgi:hypothetical protein